MNNLCGWLKDIVKTTKMYWTFKKFYFFVCMYKMVNISAETWNKTGVPVIRIHENDDVNKTLLWLLCISDISKRWGGTNIYDPIDKEIKGKYKFQKMKELTKQ